MEGLSILKVSYAAKITGLDTGFQSMSILKNYHLHVSEGIKKRQCDIFVRMSLVKMK